MLRLKCPPLLVRLIWLYFLSLIISGCGGKFPTKQPDRAKAEETEDWVISYSFKLTASYTTSSFQCWEGGWHGQTWTRAWAPKFYRPETKSFFCLSLPKRKLASHEQHLHAGLEKFSYRYQHIVARWLIWLMPSFKLALSPFADLYWSSDIVLYWVCFYLKFSRNLSFIIVTGWSRTK